MRLFTLISAFGLALDFAFADSRPNIVIIMADDMGCSDLSCYGGEIPTPHLDSLAANGLRFTRFYNTSRCCPTRASLLTGLYSHQAGVGGMTQDKGLPGYRGALNDQCVTIGKVASSAGYLTAVSGKWHVGDREKSMWPVARGFDRFYGIPEGGGFYFQLKKGRSIVLNETVIASFEKKPLPEGWYSTDAFTENGLKFIDQAMQAKKPFLLYLAHNAPHFPLQAAAADIALFRGKYKEGWEKLAAARHQRQVEMGIVSLEWKPAAMPGGVSEWDKLSDKEKDRFDHLMATYSATVHRMDLAVGNLIIGLKERGQFENTLILFLSDNGASQEGSAKGRTEGDPTTADSNWYAGRSWAWLSNAPFQRFKAETDEGGISTPLIAHWPAGISEKGELREQVGHVIDLMPTIVELTGATYPGDGGILPMEGKSLVSVLKGNESLDRKNPLFFEHQGNAAVIDGSEKAVRTGKKGPWRLYDLKRDRTEQKNLAEKHPERLNAMVKSWKDWATRCLVIPSR